MKFPRIVLLTGVYFMLAFPLFYFVYKYGDPGFGLSDFFSYYKLYESWNIGAVDAPFNMRLLSSFCVYLLNQAGLHYNTEIAFDSYDLSRQVFFNAVFFNFLCVVGTCTLLFNLVYKHLKDTLLAFLSGILYLLGFGTLFFELMPITDALSVLLFCWTFMCYLKRSYIMVVPLLLLIFQREYVFLAMGLVGLVDFLKYRQRFFLITVGLTVICFLIYYVLRKTVFFTPTYDHQASASFFLDSVTKLKFPLWPYLKQTLMTINIFLIYIALILYKKWRRLPFDDFAFLKIILLFIQINIISFAAVFGNNTGRYFYILVPMVIFYLVVELKPLVRASAV